MKLYPLFISVLLTLTYYTSTAQVTLQDYSFELRDSVIRVSYEVFNPGNDTSFTCQSLIMVEKESGLASPLLISYDTILIGRNKRLQVKKDFQLASVIDSSYSKVLLHSHSLPDNKLIVYHSLSGGAKQKVSRLGERKTLRPCRSVISTDSAAYPWLVLGQHPFSESMDTAYVYLVPKELERRKEERFLFKTPAKDSIDLKAPKQKNAKGAGAFYYEVKIDGYPVCKSQVLAENELEKIWTPELPDSLDVRSPVEIPKGMEDPGLKKLYKMPLITGSIGSESRVQNFKNPYSFQPANYSRIHLQLSLALPLLPVKVTSFLTTESSGQNSLNTFQVSFDKQAFENQKIQREAYLDHFITSKKSQIDQKERKLENELFHKRQEIQNSVQDSLLQSQKDSLLARGLRIIDDSMAMLDRRLKEMEKEQTDSVANYNDSLGYDTDSAYKAMVHKRDSLMDLKETRMRQLDSIKRVSAEIAQKVEAARNSADMISQTVNSLKKGKEDLANMEKRLKKLKSGQRLMDHVKNVEVGRFSAGFSDLSAQGLQMHGVYVRGTVNAYEISGFYGKSSIAPISHFPMENNELKFTRPSMGIRVIRKINKTNSVKLNFLRMADSRKLATDPMLLKNNVLTVEPTIEILPHLILSGEFGLSAKKVFDFRVIAPEQEKFVAANFNTAFTSGLKYELEKIDLVVGAGFKRIGPQYFTAGNIFLRKNYSEYEASADKKLFDKKLKVKLTYKYNLDNLDNSKAFTTKMKGYGVIISSQFKKGPNFLFSYMPFETQSSFSPNTFTDPSAATWMNSYYTATRTEVLLFNLNHQVKIKELSMYLSSGLTRSSFILNEQASVMTNLNNVVKGAYRTMEFQVQQSIMKASPSDQDSFSQNSYSATVLIALKRIKFTGGLEYMYRNQDKYLGQITGLETSLKGIQVRLMTNIGWLNEGFYMSSRRRTIQANLQLFYFF